MPMLRNLGMSSLLRLDQKCKGVVVDGVKKIDLSRMYCLKLEEALARCLRRSYPSSHILPEIFMFKRIIMECTCCLFKKRVSSQRSLSKARHVFMRAFFLVMSRPKVNLFHIYIKKVSFGRFFFRRHCLDQVESVLSCCLVRNSFLPGPNLEPLHQYVHIMALECTVKSVCSSLQ